MVVVNTSERPCSGLSEDDYKIAETGVDQMTWGDRQRVVVYFKLHPKDKEGTMTVLVDTKEALKFIALPVLCVLELIDKLFAREKAEQRAKQASEAVDGY